jgi:hypothetical protein
VACAFIGTTLNCPSIATYTWPASNTALYTVWVT